MTKINKEGWEIKKLPEIATIQYGYAFDSKCFTDDSSRMPLIRIRDVVRGYSETFFNGEYPENYIITKGDLLIGMDGEFNIARWQSRDALLNQRVCKISSASESLNEQYLHYFMKVCLKAIEDETPFVTVKHLSAKRLNQVAVNLPPLPTQHRIVDELDEINAIISAKKLQLQKLDELAQSIFYDMFGDPVANEKGWEVKKLNDVVKFAQGMQVPIENQKLEKSKGDVRFLRIIDFTQGKDAPRYISEFDKKCFITKDDIAIVRYGTPGFVCTNKEGVIANNLFRIIPTSKVFEGKTFLQYWLNSNAFQAVVKGNQYGAALQAIKFSTIKDLTIILPPLPLQETFAARVSAIEDEKAAIAASIEKMQNLLDERMQEYFG